MSVLDFSATAGWNEQASTVTIKLVKDECAGPRDYFDDNFNWQTSVNFPAGDPGFNNAPIGSAAFFKVEDFEFAGIIQSFNVTEDPGGFPILIVNLISPNILLDGAQVITDEYQGSVLSMPNVFNVYGWLESRTNNCPKVGGFGAPAGGFGNARRNERGIPWYFAKGALQVLLGGIETSDYSWHGGITYKQGLTAGKYGSIRSEGYVVDITDLPTTTDIYYRLTNGNYTLSELISEVCKDGGYEYYVDLVPCKGGATPPITNVIKIRTVSRRSQPALGEISTFITDQNAGPAGKIITQDSIGEELRNDSPNSAFIVGAKKKQTYEQTSASFITPFWGFNDSGGFNTAVNTGGQWQITVDVRSLNLSLNTTLGANSITFSESTLLAAMGSSQDAFLSWLKAYAPSSNLGTYFFTTLSLNAPMNILKGVALGKPATDAAKPAGQGSKDPKTTQAKDAQTVYEWLKSYGEQVYGKQWLVAVPWVCYTNDPETNQLLLSDEPSTDGAWPNTLTSVLGMTFPSSYTDFFADEQGKLQTIMKFTGAINTSLLSDEDYVTDGTNVWVKGEINEKWALLPSTFFGAQYAAGLITIPNRVTISPTLALSQTIYGGANFRAPSVPAAFDPVKNPAAVPGPAALPFFAPVSAALPVKSNTTTYGPWLATASSLIVNGHPFGGKIYYEQDDGLAPWEYGGFTFMNLGAAAKIDNSITNETVAERGSVTLAGYPEKTLGLAITDSPSLVASRVLQNGLYQGSNYYYVNTGGVSTKAAQITNIQVTVNGSAITTQYQISSFTPVFGRFTKDNAERVKQIGQQRLEFGRKVRAALAREARLAAGQRKAALQQFQNMLNQSDSDTGASWLLTGKRFATNRNQIVNNTIQGSSQYDDYDESAGMSMDGVMRPVMKRAGTADLAKEVAAATPPNTNKNFTWAPPPPINEYTPMVVNTNYLDPLATPNSTLTSDTRSDNADQGHDMNVIFRGTKTDFDADDGQLSIPQIEEDGGDGYAQTDYRYLAMRGPIMLNAWGYDMVGKPVPNSNGDSAGNWDASYNSKTDQFASDWLTDNKLWPTAPIDLRYDRRRGVWTCPPGFRIYEVTVKEPIAPGQSSPPDTCVVTNAADVYDDSGASITQKTITVYNNTATTIPCGTILAYYDDSIDEYWPIFPGSSTKFGDSAPCDGTPGVAEYKDVAKLNFSDGIKFEITPVTTPDPQNPETDVCATDSIGTVTLDLKINGAEAAPYLRFEDTATVTFNVDTTNPCVTTISANAAGGGGSLSVEGQGLVCDGGVVGPINNVTEIVFGDGIRVLDDLGTPFVSVKKEVKGYKDGPPTQVLNTWGTDDTKDTCSPFNSINIGYGLSLIAVTTCSPEPDTCDWLIKTDLRVRKESLLPAIPDCPGQDPKFNDVNGVPFAMLEFGEYLKVSDGPTYPNESVLIDVCPPDTDFFVYKCNADPTTDAALGTFNLNDTQSVNFIGFELDTTNPIPEIRHRHTAFIEGVSCDIKSTVGDNSVGIDFNDLVFKGSCFTINAGGGNINQQNFIDCPITIELCGIDKNVEVVCDVTCGGNTLTKKTIDLEFECGLLKSVTDCTEPTTESQLARQSATSSNNTVTSSNYTVPNAMSSNVMVNTSLGDTTITLPDPSTMGPYQVVVIKTTGDANSVIIETPGSETINGQNSITLTNQYEGVKVITDGTNWFIAP
jgi:hypothetical protein